jgi:glutamate synthase domain-containing protein 1
VSLSQSALNNKLAYMKMFFLGGSLQPQLDELEKSEDELLKRKEENIHRELLQIITEANQQVDAAILEIEAVPFGKGDSDQIKQLKETVTKTKCVQADLQVTLAEQQVENQKRIEEREMLQRKLAEMQQLLRSKQADSFANQLTLLDIGNSLSKYLGTNS